jgi:hypothetical protein
MKRHLTLLSVLLLYCSVLLSQTRFNNRYNIDYNDIGIGIQKTINNYIVTSTTFDNDSNLVRVQTITIDSLGDLKTNFAFSKPNYLYYGGAPGGLCVVNSAEYAEAGTIIDSSNNFDATIFKFNALGDTIWMNRQNDSSNTIGRAIKLTSDNGFILVGQTEMNLAFNLDIIMRKTDSIGNHIFE